ncbi:hypothetical protein [Metamycoplasma hominis]|uniref:hypothetical protein n=1 Tax=Metamycoplasma hominis TaxID=2098 RepID=UPI003CE7D355
MLYKSKNRVNSWLKKWNHNLKNLKSWAKFFTKSKNLIPKENWINLEKEIKNTEQRIFNLKKILEKADFLEITDEFDLIEKMNQNIKEEIKYGI